MQRSIVNDTIHSPGQDNKLYLQWTPPYEDSEEQPSCHQYQVFLGSATIISVRIGLSAQVSRSVNTVGVAMTTGQDVAVP